jgi:hypothetical protein
MTNQEVCKLYQVCSPAVCLALNLSHDQSSLSIMAQSTAGRHHLHKGVHVTSVLVVSTLHLLALVNIVSPVPYQPHDTCHQLPEGVGGVENLLVRDIAHHN